VFLSKEHRLHTTRSWEFLGLRRIDINTAWQKGRFGENTIIANIDTGILNFTIFHISLIIQSKSFPHSIPY